MRVCGFNLFLIFTFFITGCGLDISLPVDPFSNLNQKITIQSPTDEMVATEGDNVLILFSFSEIAPVDLSLSWSLSPSGASDFNTSSGTKTIREGDRSFSIQLSTIDDLISEPAKSFELTITSSSERVDDPQVIKIHLNDNDNDIDSFSITGISGGTDVSVDDELQDGNTPTVSWTASSNITHYEVSILSGDGSSTVCTPATATAVSTSIDLTGCLLSDGLLYRASVTAVNDYNNRVADNHSFQFYKTPTLSIANGGTTSESDVSGFATITVSLSAPSQRNISFDWSTVDGTAVSAGSFKDFDSVTNQSVTIMAGNASVNLQIPLTDDPRDEDTQTFQVSLINVQNALLPTSTATHNISDDDAMPTLSVADITLTEGESVNLVVTSSELSEKTITFDYSSSNGTALSPVDFSSIGVTPGTINPGVGSLNIPFNSTHDADVCEDTETASFQLSNLVNATAGDLTAAITIEEDDLPELTLSKESATEGSALTFNVNLSFACPATSVSFDYYTAGGTATAGIDYTFSSGNLSIPATQSTTSITVPTIQDTVSEGDETIFIGIKNKLRVLPNGGGVTVGTILDDEVGVATKKVVTLYKQSCALSTDGQVKCWGDKDHLGYAEGNLGDQPGEMGDNLPQLDFGTHDAGGIIPHWVKQFSDTRTFGCAILDDDRVKCWGNRNSRALGGDIGSDFYNAHYGDQAGEMGDNLPYVDMGTPGGGGGTPHTAIDIASGGRSTCVVLETNQVKCWGNNWEGQLGRGDNVSDVHTTAQMGDNLPYVDLGTHDGLGVTPHTARQVATTGGAFCALLDTNQLKCWGQGANGEHGAGYTLDIGDEPGEMGDNLPYVDLGTHDGLGVTPHSVKEIHGNGEGLCALLDTDQIKCWGDGIRGNFGIGYEAVLGDEPGEMGDNLPYVDLGTHDGLGFTPHTVKKIATSSGHTCVILDDDRMKCWGSNVGGALGIGNSSESVWGDQPGEMGDNLPYVDLGTGLYAVDVNTKSYSNNHNVTYVARNDGSLVSFGNNRFGQLGYGDTFSRGLLPADMGDNLVPIDLGTGRAFKAFPKNANSYGEDYLCVILDNDQIKCWGKYRASLGTAYIHQGVGDSAGEIASRAPLPLPTGRSVEDIFIGRIHPNLTTYCLLLDGSLEVYCMSREGEVYNMSGSYGATGGALDSLSDSVPLISSPSGKKILELAFTDKGCLLDEDLDLYCSASNLSTATKVDFGRDLKVLDIANGRDHYCALLSDQTVRCWGQNTYGQLGIESTTDFPTPGPTLQPALLGSVGLPVAIKAFDFETCVHFDNGGVKCWGRDDHVLGQALNGANQTGNEMGDDPGEMGDNLNFIDVGTGRSVVQLHDTLTSALCATLDNSTTVCWGAGGYGRLGVGNTNNYGSNAGTMGDNLPGLDLGGATVNQLTTGYFHSCAVTTTGEIKCWGTNILGALGHEDSVSKGDEPGEMGAALPTTNISW